MRTDSGCSSADLTFGVVGGAKRLGRLGGSRGAETFRGERSLWPSEKRL